MTTIAPDARQKLKDLDRELAESRSELAVLKRDAEKARAAFVKAGLNDPKNPVFKRAQKASEEVADANKKVEDLDAVKVGLLEMFGANGNVAGRDQNGPSANGIAGGNPWRHVAEQIDLEGGVTRVEMPAADLLRPSGPMAAGFNVSPGSGWTAPSYLEEGIAARGRDERHIYETLPQVRVEQGDLALTEFQQTGSRTVTGTVERDPLATGEKAALELSLALATPSLEMFAVVVSEVPSQLFLSTDALTGFLQDELAFQIRVALDAHVIAQITAATPPHSKTGADSISQIRNALAAARALGAKPSVLAVTPAEASALDLTKTELGYVFALAKPNGASPIFGMDVIEVPTGLAAPLLIDPQLLGRMYLAQALLFIDPYSGMSKNQVRVRLEVNGLAHVRDVSGAYQVKT